MMLPFVGSWLLSKGLGAGGQKIMGIGLIVVVLAGVAWKIRSDGIELGKRKARIEQVENDLDTQKARQQNLVDTVRQQEQLLSDAKERADQFAEREKEWQSMARESSRLIANLQVQRQAVQKEIDTLSAEEFAPRIKRVLNLRHPDAYALSGYFPAEEKEILRCLLDRPLCEEQNQELQSKVTSLDGQIEALEGRVQAVGEQAQALTVMLNAHLSYETFIEGAYERAVNALGRKKRSFKCLFVWKCTEKKLKVPTLDTLLQKKPSE